MKKLLFTVLLISLSAGTPAVEVPDFSFKGEEISFFAINSGFRDVDINFQVESEYTNYIEKESIKIAEDEGGEYSSEEPSGIYGSRAGTALAAIFVGDKAYRNFLVKKYIQGAYSGLVDSYHKYSKNIQTPEFQEETRLLYHMSQLVNGDESGRAGIFEICATGSFYKNVACDRYTEMLVEAQNLKELTTLPSQIQRPIPVYTFSAAVLAAFRLGNYAGAEKMLADNPDIIFSYPDLNDLRAVVLYRNGNYSAVANLMGYTTESVLFITADSLINLERFEEAADCARRVPEPDRYYLEAKLNLGRKDNAKAIAALKQMSDQWELFDLLGYYAARNIPEMTDTVLGAFKFTDEDKKDYPAYYMGLQQMELKRYRNAVGAFDKVKAPAELVNQARFYRGMAQVYLDPAKAEADIAYSLNYSKNPEQVAQARFMLAQIYNLKGRTDEAAQLIDGCTESYCRQLAAEIFLKQGNYQRALESTAGEKTPEAHMIRATAYFNLKDYGLSRQEADNVTIASRELTHLKMMLLFKEGNVSAATNILITNKNYKPIVYDGVRELILAGNYELAGQLLGEQKTLSPRLQVENARILAWSGKTDEARSLYNGLITRKEMLYDALSGLVALEKGDAASLSAIRTVMEKLPEYGEFTGKDMLLNEFAAKAARGRDNVLVSNIINAFFPDHENSAHAGRMYATRAGLFYSTGRYNECMQDIAVAIEKSPELADELRYTNAQCMQEVDMAKALDLYRGMFASDEQYKLLSAVKIMDNTEDANEVLAVAESLKANNPNLYLEGLRRFMELADPSELEAHTAFLKELSESEDTRLKCAGLYGSARMTNEQGRGRDAAEIYYQIYETDPKDHFATPALSAAQAIYEELNMPKEAGQIKTIIRNQ